MDDCTSQLNFHSVPTSAVPTLNSTTAGLSSDEAYAGLQKLGSNRLPEPPKCHRPFIISAGPIT
ncbi:MAG: hypothetical protein JNL45_18135 [Hyphomicrobium sp.]|nr:hypothetical protein [Hyphomicrobium sp.]